MNGAIPYHKIQSRTAQSEKRAEIFPEEQSVQTHELLCEMAHCINNFLMRIQGWTSLMLLDLEEGQAGFDRLKLVENHIGYGAVLTSQLLACVGRGVYADPVNIPPLLLEQHDGGKGPSGPYDVKSNLFIVMGGAGRVQPEFLDLYYDISQKIAGLFNGIEKVLMSGHDSGLEKHYLAKIRKVTGEGFTLATRIASVFKADPWQPASPKRFGLNFRTKRPGISLIAGFK